MFTLNPEQEKIIERKEEDPDRRFSPEFESLLEKYQKDKKL